MLGMWRVVMGERALFHSGKMDVDCRQGSTSIDSAFSMSFSVVRLSLVDFILGDSVLFPCFILAT